MEVRPGQYIRPAMVAVEVSEFYPTKPVPMQVSCTREFTGDAAMALKRFLEKGAVVQEIPCTYVGTQPCRSRVNSTQIDLEVKLRRWRPQYDQFDHATLLLKPEDFGKTLRNYVSSDWEVVQVVEVVVQRTVLSQQIVEGLLQ